MTKARFFRNKMYEYDLINEMETTPVKDDNVSFAERVRHVLEETIWPTKIRPEQPAKSYKRR